MKEIDINSMEQKKCYVHYNFLVYEIPTEKIPHKYIGGKKKNYPIKIKSTDIILCFLFQCLHHAIILCCQTQNIPLNFIFITNLVQLIPFKKDLDIL